MPSVSGPDLPTDQFGKYLESRGGPDFEVTVVRDGAGRRRRQPLRSGAINRELIAKVGAKDFDPTIGLDGDGTNRDSRLPQPGAKPL
jgi:hypothetical protein